MDSLCHMKNIGQYVKYIFMSNLAGLFYTEHSAKGALAKEDEGDYSVKKMLSV